METPEKPISNNKQESLKSENPADFFAKKSIEAAREAWDKNGWDDAKVEELLKTHLRTTYNAYRN